MEQAEIKKIVSLTIDELYEKRMLDFKDSDLNYRYMSKKLYDHYLVKESKGVRDALELMKSDKYIKIISFYYERGMTLEEVADNMCCDYSTIVRNKKRLVLQLFELMEG